MSRGDFDIAGLAKYLHLSAARVAKMAERDRLPGRKIGGQWRFSQAEIHHWLEDRIGAAEDEEQLAHVQGVLDRHDSAADICIASLISREAIAIPLTARTRSSAISAMCELASRTGLLWDADKMGEAVRSRENLHPTALENGVALLHPRRPMSGILAEPLLALGITPRGIPFGGGRGKLTDIFFLICSTDDAGHLHTLAQLSRLISNVDFLVQLRDAEDAVAAHELVKQFEDSQ